MPRTALALALLACAAPGAVCARGVRTNLLRVASAPRPRVHFLFLAVDRIQRLDVWRRFFAEAPTEDYRVIWHCKDVGGCLAQLSAAALEEGSRNIFGRSIEVVENPANSYYCTDLVSAENKLLETALVDPVLAPGSDQKASFLQRRANQSATSARDKFVLLSDSSLPLKPFHEVYRALTAAEDSRFCIFPRQEWAKAPRETCADRVPQCSEWAATGQCQKNARYMLSTCQKSCEVCSDLAVSADAFPNGKDQVAVKTHEWKVLSREDAKRSVKLWHKGYLHGLMGSFHLNYRDSYHNTGCLDEFWHFAALYGTFPGECMDRPNNHAQCQAWADRGECKRNPNYMLQNCYAACSQCRIPASKFVGGAKPLQLTFVGGAGVQGQCDTFVVWSIAGAMGSEDGEFVKLERQLKSTPGTDLRPGGTRPDTIMSVGVTGLEALRRSSFLFARKFESTFRITDSCLPSADAFADGVLGQSPHSQKGTWMGSGVWIDSASHQVSIVDNPAEPGAIVIQNGHDPAWSGWGRVCGDQVVVHFSNREQLTGHLDTSSGLVLRFSNGVTWYRDLPWRGDGIWRNTYNNTVQVSTLGGHIVSITDTNPEWNAAAKLSHPLSDSLHATFNKVMDGRHVVLWGKLSSDAQTISWHNGHIWRRDPDHVIPCACRPDHAYWQVAPHKDQRCLVAVLGGAGDGRAELAAVRAGHYDTGSFAADTCRVVLADGDSKNSAALTTLGQSSGPLVTALPATAPYCCEVPGKVQLTGSGKVVPTTSPHGAVSLMNVMRFLKEQAVQGDRVVLKLGAGIASWEVIPCLARSSAARLVDVLYLGRFEKGASPSGLTVQQAEQAVYRLKQMGVRVVIS